MNRIANLVSVKTLAERLVSPKNIRVLDGSWHLPASGRNARKEFEEKHIPGALFFDIDQCSDKNTDLDHMLPTPSFFEDYVGKLGINNDTHVYVYDSNESFGLFSAQRVWWTFRVFGHDKISILDGGLHKWCSEGYEVTNKIQTFPAETYKVMESNRDDFVKSFDDIAKNIETKEFQVVDARAAGRFQGTSPEPRQGIKPGHFRGSVNIPFTSIMDPDTKTVKTETELREMFKDAGVDLTKPLVASCGSGVTACCIVLAAALCGKDDVAVYDGSWTEWFLRSRPEQRECCPED